VVEDPSLALPVEADVQCLISAGTQIGMSMQRVQEELKSWLPVILVWLAFVAMGLTIVGVLFELSE
jgi:hypothetical protein